LVFAPLEEALQTVANFNVTEVRCSASQARVLLETQAKYGYPLRIEQFSTGGGQLTVEAADEIARTFTSNVINTYSSTEMVHMGLAAGAVLQMRRSKGNCFVPCAEIEIVSEAKPDRSRRSLDCYRPR
jgi:acyl-coenzyme A synthetase/AMP-(fatty) acid ligase